MTQILQDESLLKLCLTGDERAWTIFVERFSAMARWSIKVKLSKSGLSINDNEIDDILQQIFTDIWCNNRLKALRSSRSLSSWLVITAQNAAINFARDKKRFFKSEPEPLEEDTASTSANPRTEADNSQLHKTVEELISALPLKERRIMSLELFYDLRHRQIAEIMGLPINTVSTIIARLKKDFRDRLTKRGYNV